MASVIRELYCRWYRDKWLFNLIHRTFEQHLVTQTYFLHFISWQSAHVGFEHARFGSNTRSFILCTTRESCLHLIFSLYSHGSMKSGIPCILFCLLRHIWPGEIMVTGLFTHPLYMLRTSGLIFTRYPRLRVLILDHFCFSDHEKWFNLYLTRQVS